MCRLAGGMFSKVIWSLLRRLLLEGARINGFVTARMLRLGSVVGGRLDGVSFVASYTVRFRLAGLARGCIHAASVCARGRIENACVPGVSPMVRLQRGSGRCFPTTIR